MRAWILRPCSILWTVAAFLFIAGLGMLPVGSAAEKEAAKSRQLSGLQERTPWTSSRVNGTPEPPSPYQTEVAFAGVKFDEPLCLIRLPKSRTLAISERQGKVYFFDPADPVNSKHLVLDTGRANLGLAFHPKFAENGEFFVTTLQQFTDEPGLIRVSRYKLSQQNPPKADAASEEPIIQWRANGHRGGCLEFGPDGYLYIAVGDGSGIADERVTGQDITDLYASLLRIDVNGRQGELPYRIPEDNPFVGQKVNGEDARGEVWAYGLRQAWKFSFDSQTNELWTGDVGQDLWESVHLIRKGGNYGWSVKEGSHPFRPQRPLGPTPIIPPIVEHPHVDYRSITGGYVYHGDRLKELQGAYIYGDYDTGKVAALRYENGQVTDHRELADTQLRIVDFGQDADGELYLVDHIGGQLHRLVPTPPQPANAPRFPHKLSETGLFASTKDHIPAPGVIPYSVNAALWSDGAEKLRLLAVPGDAQIEFETVTYPQPAPGSLPGWRFPHGTVLVKTFSLEMEEGNPASTRRLETRLLHHERIPGSDEVGAQMWHGYTYVWNEAQTDAVLLDKNGRDEMYTIRQKDGTERKQAWHFPSRAECTLCHTMSAKYVLGVTTQQMNRDHDYGGVIANQIATLNHIGMFTRPVEKSPEELAKLADYHDEQAALDDRARAYLHANCAHCHRKWGGGNAEFQLLSSLPLAETGTIGTLPGQGTFELNDPRIVVPGHPERSLVFFRMQKLGLGRMPHIASTVIDEEGTALIKAWLEKMEQK